MIIHVAYFGGESFRKLAQVLKRSILANCPTATLDMVKIEQPAPIANAAQHVAWNTHKLTRWCDCVQAADEPVVLMDADMLVLGDLAEAFDIRTAPGGLLSSPVALSDGALRRLRDSVEDWAESKVGGPKIVDVGMTYEPIGFDFDVAYTVRPGKNLINAGVVFVQNTEAGKRFVREWSELNDELVAKGPECISDMVATYGGINQAAISLTVQRCEGVALHELECAVWNSTRQTWIESIMGLEGVEGYARPKVVHINSRLRRSCFTGRRDVSGEYAYIGPLVTEWLKYTRGR